MKKGSNEFKSKINPSVCKNRFPTDSSLQMAKSKEHLCSFADDPAIEKALEKLISSKETSAFQDLDPENPSILLDQQKNLEIRFACHNLVIDPECRILIVGICPGKKQTEIGFQTFFQTEDLFEAKKAARYAGSSRTNLINMLDDLEIETLLGHNAGRLFENPHLGLDTTALIPFPVYSNGKNYSGHSPVMHKNDLLASWIEKTFVPLANSLKHLELIIPLGTACEKELVLLEKQGLIKKIPILKGFPHPSGLNAGRKKQFENHKESMKKTIRTLVLKRVQSPAGSDQPEESDQV